MKSSQALLRIVKDSRCIAGKILLAALCILLTMLLSLLCPELIQRLTDSLYDFWNEQTPIDWQSFGIVCLILAGAYLVKTGLEIAKMRILNQNVTNYFTAGIRTKLSDKITRLPLSYLDKTPNGDIIARMNSDVSVLGSTVHTLFEIGIEGILSLIAITVIIFLKNAVMAAVIAVFVPLSLVASLLLSRRSEKHFNEYREENAKVYAFVEENDTGFDTVKAFRMEKMQAKLHAALVEKAAKKAEKGYYLSGLVQPVVGLMNHLVFIAMCLVGGLLAIKGSISVGAVVAFILYARMYSAPLQSIALGFSYLQNTVSSAKRVYGFLDLPEMTEQEGRKESCVGEVRFENVCFSYDPEKPLIRDLTFTAKPGQKVAIVGPTGGGKTTIVNLLMRFYDYDSGNIFIDGTEILSMNRADLRNQFSMVLQDTWLFGGTIYENIAYGRAGATKEEVIDAAKRAHIHSFIESLPKGYDTLIGEEADGISGGQKQLLTIARAYLADRPMLILDEATSNVDTRTELLIQKTMDELMEGRTSFVIAHRLSTIVDADVILVVRDGQIVEQGTHRELIQKNGFYAEIYNAQYASVG